MNKQKTHILLFVGAILIFLSSCKNEEHIITKKPKYVKISQVIDSENTQTLVFNGVIKENKLSSLSFRVGGPLIKLEVKPGDYIEKGELIAQIDSRDYQLQLNSTKAQYEQIKGEYDRYQQLYDKDKIPANSFEKIKSAYLMAEVAYTNAKNQIYDTKLLAPYSGYIHEKKTENFQTVGPGQEIVTIIDLSKLKVIINVPESKISDIQKDNKNYLNINNLHINHLPIRINSISEKTYKNGLYQVEFIFKNENEMTISPGMTAEVSIEITHDDKNISIPSSALHYKNDKTCVWVYDYKTQTIKQRAIEVKGMTKDGNISVMSGISFGETVITTGVTCLTEGQIVEPIKPISETNIGGLL